MSLHDEIINITIEKRKQNLAIDEAMKNNRNMKDILVAVYARGHRDARQSAAEKVATCEHVLIDARNEVISSGSYCSKCGKLD